MLSKELCNKILTIGCEYNPPKGGIAQVMFTYSQEVYSIFNCVTNSGAGGLFFKIWKFSRGLVKMTLMLLFNKKIKLVHIHTASYHSFERSSFFVFLAKWFCRKVVLHIHGGGFKDYYKTNPKTIKKVLQKADCIITLSETWKQFFTEELQLSNVVTVKNIIPKPHITKVEKDGMLHLLFLGYIINQKGIFDLLEVIKDHKKEWEGKLILHVGGSHEVGRLLMYINDNGLERLIKYEGWVSGEKKIQLLNLSDALILPSYTEGLPISVLEALSYGKPVITTPVGGLPEVINKKNGYLFLPGNRKAMSKIINSIIDNPSALSEKAEFARLSVECYFPSFVTESIETIYHNLLVE